MNLFEYAQNLVLGINKEAIEKLDNPKPYLLDEGVDGCATVTDRGEIRSKGTIYARARVEKQQKGEDFGSWEYNYGPHKEQKTVDWMIENDPAYFMKHIAACRNRARGQVLRMDDLQDYATDRLFSKK